MAPLTSKQALVADPAFHLLHCAQRKVRRGQKDDAIEDINHALRLLGNAKSPAEDRALRLMRQALGKQSTEKHHKAKLREVFELFPEHDQLRREALDLLSEDPPIDGGEPAIEAPPTTVPPTLSVSTQPQPAPRPLRGRSYWTERADRNPLDD
jgi:hypothetical protein